MKVIKNKAVVDDDWRVLRLTETDTAEGLTIPAGKVVVPLAVWQAQRATLQTRGDLGVWLNSDESAESLAKDLDQFALIAVNFPKFADGRGYTIAQQLRVRLNYCGELRAIGDVLRDQLFYMQRVGFDAFEVRADKNIDAALLGLSDFSVRYQASSDEPQPLFRRETRGEVHE